MVFLSWHGLHKVGLYCFLPGLGPEYSMGVPARQAQLCSGLSGQLSVVSFVWLFPSIN